MNLRFDEKGKYYTTHVSKQKVYVRIMAQGLLISGVMYLLPDNRVKDELNNGERFVAITDARVRQPGSDVLLSSSETLILNKDQIVWVVPNDASDESDSPTDDASGS